MGKAPLSLSAMLSWPKHISVIKESLFVRLLAFNVTFVAQLDRFFDGVAAVSVIKAAI